MSLSVRLFTAIFLAHVLLAWPAHPVSATLGPGGHHTALSNHSVLAAGPAISQVAHTPALPGDANPIVVTARVTANPAAVQNVELHYRVMFGGVTTVAMQDNGASGDGAAGDGVFGATIPAAASQPGEMVRYFVTARDAASVTSRLPTFFDPEGSPEYFGTMIAHPAVSSALPIFNWFVQDPAAAETRDGTRASVFYNGVFYDNVEVGIRGETSITWPKHNYKFEFNQGYYFTLPGVSVPFKEFRINTTYADKSYMRTVLAWETYRDAGVPGSLSFPMRVQQNREFFSVAHFVEIPEEYLARHNMDPDGALYKMDNELTSWTDFVEKETREDEGNGDLQHLVEAMTYPPDGRARYMFDTINIPEVINYLAASALMHDNDFVAKNYYLYRDTNGNGEWTILPWDKDLTFGRSHVEGEGALNDEILANDDPFSHPLFGGEAYPKVDGYWNRLYDAVFETPVLREMYLRRLRTLMDTLLQPPGNADESTRYYERRINELFGQMQADVVLDSVAWPLDWGSPQSFPQAVNIL